MDELYDKAALAFLLAKTGVACTCAFGPTNTPGVVDKATGLAMGSPVAFDFSHTNRTVDKKT